MFNLHKLSRSFKKARHVRLVLKLLYHMKKINYIYKFNESEELFEYTYIALSENQLISVVGVEVQKGKNV